MKPTMHRMHAFRSHCFSQTIDKTIMYNLHIDGELACLYVLRHVQEPEENVDAIGDVNNDTKDAQDAGFKET